GHNRRLHHAPAEDHRPLGVEFRRRRRAMRDRRKRAGKKQRDQAASGSQNPAIPPQAEDSENEKRRDDGQEFANLEWDKTRYQDSRGDGSQGREQRISQKNRLTKSCQLSAISYQLKTVSLTLVA